MFKNHVWALALLAILVAMAFAGISIAEERPAQDLQTSVKPAPVQKTQDEASTPEQIQLPKSAGDLELEAILESGRQQVRELVLQLESTPDAQSRMQIQNQIIEIKRETRLQFLRKNIQVARSEGNEVRAVEAERLLELLLNPPVFQVGDVQRGTPQEAGR